MNESKKRTERNFGEFKSSVMSSLYVFLPTSPKDIKPQKLGELLGLDNERDLVLAKEQAIFRRQILSLLK